MLEEFGGNLARAGPFLDFTRHNYELGTRRFAAKPAKGPGTLGQNGDARAKMTRTGRATLFPGRQAPQTAVKEK